MIEQMSEKGNLNRAYQKVVSNKGAGEIDRLQVSDLQAYLRKNGVALTSGIRSGSFQPQPIKGSTIPKSSGKSRLLGVPNVADRVVQQALLQVLKPLFKPDFRPYSYGFRPNRNGHQAVKRAQEYINEVNQYVVNMALRSFFDEVDHAVLLELVYSLENA